MATKKRSFNIGGVALVWSDVEVSAESFEEALKLSKNLKASDFLESDSVNDCAFKVVQVYDPDFKLEL